MTIFVDTSALYALLDEDDSNHPAAGALLTGLRGERLVTHAYVVVEALALVGRRLGWPAVERLLSTLMPVVEVVPVGTAVHQTALSAFREAGSDRVSFVDRVSFAFMRAERIQVAFAFDADFAAAGFDLPE